jgi:MFS transporter, DHA1 family, multidrug resistance protein
LLCILACLAALGTLATNILLPSLPHIAQSFMVPTPATGSMMSAFFATFALGQLFVGPLSDRTGACRLCSADSQYSSRAASFVRRRQRFPL